MAMAQANNTPVSKKTRSAVRQNHKMENDRFGTIDAVIAETKTPTTANRITSGTPRRSARKSVRPRLDYEDIIEKNTMNSATKEKKNCTTSTAAGEEGGKWVAADVGRHSCKRHRSRSSKANKRAKVEEKILKEDWLEGGNKEQFKEEENKQSEQQLEKTKKEEEHQRNETANLENGDENDTTTTTVSQLLKASKDADTTPIIEAAELNLTVEADLDAGHPILKLVASKESDADPVPISVTSKSNTLAADPIIESETELVFEYRRGPSSELKAAEKVLPLLEAAKVNLDDMDELGLCPLQPEEQLKEDDNEDHDNEMLSLIMVDEDDDDVEPEGNVLNRTFDADQKADEDVALNNQADNNMYSKQQPKDRFPTPLKGKSKPILKFNDCLPLIVGSPITISPLIPNNNSLQVPLRHSRKRSISVSGMTNVRETKTVSFNSPIEVPIGSDINNRWNTLNVSNVTQRRKRSMSLDENPPFISRIPRPKQYAPAPAAAVVKVATPGNKLKMRTKLPDFAAIHQKQFGKMENLVDHIERKALRAKQLTSSALKQQQETQTIGSTAKKLPVKTEERSRPRALKKIELANELERQKRLPTPRKIVDKMASKPKSNIPTTRLAATATTTTSTKPFNFSASIAPVSKIDIPSATSSSGSVQGNKAEIRRQRHMEMFKKSGTAKKDRKEHIRGVRSNKRFDLQMQYRQLMDG